MAKKQSRRSISVNRTSYEEAKDAANLADKPLSQFTEEALRAQILPIPDADNLVQISATHALLDQAGVPQAFDRLQEIKCTLVERVEWLATRRAVAPVAEDPREAGTRARAPSHQPPVRLPLETPETGGAIIRECGADAQKWAAAFVRMYPDPLNQPDVGTMIAWFANAMMAQHDHAKRGEDRLSAAEALNGFVGWLTTRATITKMGSTEECSVLVPLITRFCDANQLAEPRELWHEVLNHPEHVPELDGPRVGTSEWVGTTIPTGRKADLVIIDDPDAPPIVEPVVVYDEPTA